MAFRDDLKTFLATDIRSRITAISLASDDVYFGHHPRVPRGDQEAWCRYANRLPLELELGRLSRHVIDVQLYIAGVDNDNEDNLAELLEESAEQLIAAYEEPSGLAILRAGVTSGQIYAVKIGRGEASVRDDRMARWLPLSLMIDERVR